MTEINHPNENGVETEIVLEDGTELVHGRIINEAFGENEVDELYKPVEGNWFYSYQDGFVCKVVDRDETFETVTLEMYNDIDKDNGETMVVSENWFDEYGDMNFGALIERPVKITETIEVSRETLEFALSQMESEYLDVKDFPSANEQYSADEIKKMIDEIESQIE